MPIYTPEAPDSHDSPAIILPPSESLSPPTRAEALNDLPPLRSILDIQRTPPDPADTLLGERFLCRGGVMLFTGPSGIGKSSASMQQDMLWAVNREAFGIKPARPLKILTIQAENDDGDLYEMAQGVERGICNDFTPHEMNLLGVNLHYQTITSSTGDGFLAHLRALVQEDEYDLVRTDPFFAYYGQDIVDTKALSLFLRAGINPILKEFNVGMILAHHTPKTTNRDTSAWSASDYAYSGAGGAEMTNMARAIIAIDTTATPGTFKFVGAKRGGRTGWRDSEGNKEDVRYYRHAEGEGAMHWEEGDAMQVDCDTANKQKERRGKAVDAAAILESLVPQMERIEKTELHDQMNKKGVGKNAANNEIKRALNAESPKFFEHKEKRSGTNPRNLISRTPPPESAEHVEPPATKKKVTKKVERGVGKN